MTHAVYAELARLSSELDVKKQELIDAREALGTATAKIQTYLFIGVLSGAIAAMFMVLVTSRVAPNNMHAVNAYALVILVLIASPVTWCASSVASSKRKLVDGAVGGASGKPGGKAA
eukprot:CAMPEP_0179212110 /NCGR_PEP_ID=MMETSP0797-20121207/904_1 /TAXON_ID=47934 /ORGANISM="Dinophysis acuminata, Strain DAEP01" /LENGTH=116 /DNA_ID=CAMNT_0020917647 /DNA_START=68 /DNA_END=418 /DNA_ORIENTATION=+